jgi:HlyD family secretion protein
MTMKMNMRMPQARTWIWAAGGVAAVAALGWAFAPRPVEVEAAGVTQGRFEQSIEEDGRTRLKDRYVVSAPVAARLARITLREGDRVAADDVVAVLTPMMSSMIDNRARQEALARAEAVDANLDAAKARLARARISLEEARLDLERNTKLAGDGFVAPSRLDSSRLAVAGARRELDAAIAAQDAAGHDREQARAALLPATAGAATGRPLEVRSPITGVVLKVALQSEGTIAAGTPLLDVGDPARMEVVAELLTTDAVQAKPGTRTVIERWGGPPVEGRVRLVEPAGFTKVSALGIEEQRVNVIVEVKDAPPAWHSVGDGFRVGVRVVTTGADAATLVPVGALFPHGNGMAVYRLDGSRARLQPVELAARNGTAAWARSGLQPGQQVIVYPPSNVADGQRVKVRTP